jgi:hypothetical protein
MQGAMLDQFQCTQQILFDLTANYLEPLATAYDRLNYLSGLLAESPELAESPKRYVHEKLASLYGAEAVNQVIRQCHQEVFERLLEMPLNAQGEELRVYLSSLPGALERNAANCLGLCKKWIPAQEPSYLKELYCSNLSVLLELLQGDKSKARPNK